MWYVILDQSGAVKQEHFETKAMLVEYLEASLRMKRIGENQWARGDKRKVAGSNPAAPPGTNDWQRREERLTW